MEMEDVGEDELLGLTSSSSDVIPISSEVNNTANAEDIDEELLLLSSPSSEQDTSSPPKSKRKRVNLVSNNAETNQRSKKAPPVMGAAEESADGDLNVINDSDIESLESGEQENDVIDGGELEEEDAEMISEDSNPILDDTTEAVDEEISAVEIEDSILEEAVEIEDSILEEVDDSVLEGKINIFYSSGALLVWNAEDAQMLREECRIIGKLSGCLPRAPRQNNHLGLPLQLLPEEAKLLVDIEAAIVVEEEPLSESIRKVREKAFTAVREDNFAIQQKLYKESRKEEVRQRMGQIIEGKKAKKRKLQEEKQIDNEDEPAGGKEDKKLKRTQVCEKENKLADEEELSEDDTEDKEKDPLTMSETTSPKDSEIDASKTKGGEGDEEEEDSLTVDDLVTSTTSVKHSLVQIFTENPWKGGVRPCTKWTYPGTEQEAIRYTVFKDLWKKGYYLTSGSKFGGDFLVYPGDPCRFHSHFIAVCLDHSHEMSVLDIVSMGRLASNVRKVTLLCSLSRRRRVSYTSLQWTGIS